MLVLNFSHPMTEIQKKEAEVLTGTNIEAIYDIRVQFDYKRPFTDQAEDLMRNLPIDGTTLQTKQILVILPSMSSIAAPVIAILHGIMGYFPSILRISPENESLPPVFHAVEVLNLQAVRSLSRTQR